MGERTVFLAPCRDAARRHDVPRLPVITTSAALLALVLSTPARAALPAADHAYHPAWAETRESNPSASGGAACPSVVMSAAWMSDVLVAGQERWSRVAAESAPPPTRPQKQRQDASFPAAFVFQQHSALFLAHCAPVTIAPAPRAESAVVPAPAIPG